MPFLLLLAGLFFMQQAVRPDLGILSGQIRDMEGSPSASVRVALMPAEETGTVNAIATTLVGLAQTDSEGRYRLERIPPGRYLVVASPLSAPTYYPGVKTPSEARSVTVLAGQAIANLDFTLPRPIGVRIRGRVRNLPVPPAEALAILQLNNLSRGPIASTLGEDGTFQFERVPAGRYSLRIDGPSPLIGRFLTEYLVVDVDDRDMDNLQVTYPRIMSGRVTVDDGSPVPTALSFAGPRPLVGIAASLPRIPSPIATATVEPDGRFILPLAAANDTGEFAITPTMTPLGYHIKSMSFGPVDLLRSPLAITPGHDSTQIEVILTRTPPPGASGGVTISGRVTNMQNATSGTVVVSLQFRETSATGLTVQGLGLSVVKADGTFEINGVPAGTYSVGSRSTLSSFNVADRDLTGVEISLQDPTVPSITIVNRQPGPVTVRTSPIVAMAPRAPLLAREGSALVSIAQSGRYPLDWRHGSLSFYRIEQSDAILEERLLEEGIPLAFTLSPGTYELRSYTRACNENCGLSIGVPQIECSVPFKVVAGEVLYAERVLQGSTCTIGFTAPPR